MAHSENATWRAEADLVASAIRAIPQARERMAHVLRDTLDQLYHGQKTGRYRWDQLYKTEKTHCGTLVEINLQREFAFSDGETLDYRIAGIEVDCKYSQRLGGWMIPPEARDQLCLLVWAEDGAEARWSAGLVRAMDTFLNAGNNRDAKATLNRTGRANILWLWQSEELQPNVLLQLDEEVVTRIFSHASGARRINELFRLAQGRRIGRAVVATVARQEDYMKRLRSNGGARSALKPEGIIILGQYRSHVDIARALGLPIPGQGESISARLYPCGFNQSGSVEIDGQRWRLASPADPVVPAPVLPKV